MIRPISVDPLHPSGAGERAAGDPGKPRHWTVVEAESAVLCGDPRSGGISGGHGLRDGLVVGRVPMPLTLLRRDVAVTPACSWLLIASRWKPLARGKARMANLPISRTSRYFSIGFIMRSLPAIQVRCSFLIAFIFVVAGCKFQPPDYLKVISAPQLNTIMRNEDVFLVDVHVPEQRHIKGTDLFVPYDEIEKYQDKFPQDKNAAIYLYCEGGPMGNAAARSLYALGYRNLTNLEGGARAWRESGFDLE